FSVVQRARPLLFGEVGPLALHHERGDTVMRSLHSGSSRVLMPILLVAIAGTVQAQSEPTLAALRSGERPLVVGGVVEFGIFNFVGRDGQPSGMDRDIIRAAAKRLG